MSDNFDDNNNENNKNTSINKPLNNDKCEPLYKLNATKNHLIIKFLKELLQELHVVFLNVENYFATNRLDKFMFNYLFEYDLDPKNVFEIMTSNSENVSHFSSLIGYFYRRGIGCEVNEIKAFEILSSAAKNNQKVMLDQVTFDQRNESIRFLNDNIKELNEIIVQYFYSFFLYEDLVFNSKNSYKLHIKNAGKGDNVSQYYIGNFYLYGVKKDYSKAIEWYSKSSEGGNIKAMYKLGVCYECGYGIKKDKKKALELYLKSAEGGYRRALYELGNRYYYGNCTFKDKDKAFEFYLKAAEKGHDISQYLVANYYYDGKCIPKNEERGFYWNRKAAINGHTEAQFKLAEYYINSSINKNERKAFKWYYKLANKYKVRAIYLVAKCYRDGIGTDKNLEEAAKWIEKYETIKFFGKSQITLNEFLNGSNIDASSIPPYGYFYSFECEDSIRNFSF
ncbi:hypothetical protein RclHR1_00150012 [Rhizophagus clarus]|uniref:Sel1-like repeat protein n=1 Tax=Rhizophagus clarus TaxID=94130 RepID=A0A2Z6R6K1_9GLOM|nr:hypothetical protein RclHR1_00150012 [Rhizophagus clarus]GET02293.1 Sel1-like repeat protein [Rhizophagus clarus]